MPVVWCTNTHRNVTDLVNHGMVKNTYTWISWERNIIFLRNKKSLNLCFRWHILRSYRFLAEVTFNWQKLLNASATLRKRRSVDSCLSCFEPSPAYAVFVLKRRRHIFLKFNAFLWTCKHFYCHCIYSCEKQVQYSNGPRVLRLTSHTSQKSKVLQIDWPRPFPGITQNSIFFVALMEAKNQLHTSYSF